MPAEREPEHRPPLVAELFAESVGVGGQILEGHERDGRALRTPVSAVIVEDQGELVRQLPERKQRPVIGARAAVHEQQGVPVADHVDVERRIRGPRSRRASCASRV